METISEDTSAPMSQPAQIPNTESLSEVDAQSLLQDPQFLDSIMKDDMQQLLTGPSNTHKQTLTQDTYSEYTSAFFKSMQQLDTMNPIKAKSDEIVDSMKIIVTND